jgi:hypothetical protein
VALLAPIFSAGVDNSMNAGFGMIAHHRSEFNSFSINQLVFNHCLNSSAVVPQIGGNRPAPNYNSRR